MCIAHISTGADASPGNEPLAGAGPALFRLVRFWSRRWVAAAVDGARGAAGAADDTRTLHLLVVEAVDAAAGRGPASVADVARELGIDRSGASRMVAAAVAAGHVAKAPAPDDTRRAALTVTPAGAALLADARAWQEQAFARLVAGWDGDDAARLAGYLRRLADESADARTDGTGPTGGADPPDRPIDRGGHP